MIDVNVITKKNKASTSPLYGLGILQVNVEYFNKMMRLIEDNYCHGVEKNINDMIFKFFD
ncbi:hypothetical protein GCM10011445_36390 [Pseudocitrobacter faecalis]|nr:hypothetical protein GCM10011445_36390 [Pseudocitrobacter faecalis]